MTLTVFTVVLWFVAAPWWLTTIVGCLGGGLLMGWMSAEVRRKLSKPQGH
ncbi:MAG: hypothetical protein AB7F99_19590 [Vicinamibacterales bacterium]